MIVQTTLLATMIMMQEKYVPIRGVSELGGCMSDTWSDVVLEIVITSKSYHVHEHCQGHQHSYLQCHLLTRVWGKIEAKYSHTEHKQII